jgi:hypothetical protein
MKTNKTTQSSNKRLKYSSQFKEQALERSHRDCVPKVAA